MEFEIKSRYNERILHEAMQRYGISPDAITLLDGFESFIYEYSRPEGDYILRIGHSRRRTPTLIRAEVEWINHLAAGGAGVTRAVESQAGRLVETIDDDHGDQFLATAFVKAPGRPAGQVGWTPSLYETYGRLLGRIHALSKGFTPADPAVRRYEWDHPDNLDVPNWLPANEPVVKGKFEHVLSPYGQNTPSTRKTVTDQPHAIW